MANALRFKQLSLDRQKGELARLKVVQGPDYGTTFVLTGPKVFLGRGEENDIILSDLKASRIHAELSAVGGGWVVKDKGSANGILHNGRATRQANLTVNDTITIGESTLEFITAEAGTQMLVAPPRTTEQIGIEQQHKAEHRDKLNRMGLSAIFSSGPSSAATQAKSKDTVRKLVIVVGVLGAGLFLLFPEDKPKPVAKKKVTTNLAAFLPEVPKNSETEMIFKDGLREYFLGNYARARTQFETVLQIVPGHQLATLYLSNVNKGIETEVKMHLDHGRKALKAGKLKASRAHFLKVTRLLNKDRSNPLFIEAGEQLENVERAYRGESPAPAKSAPKGGDTQ
ncbi:MAG: FHA domain-containing protein [Bdellovibrio sp.]|nr:FHA domain-containing protein [Bdellovibrio sp.]